MIGMGAKSITIVRAVTADFFFDCREAEILDTDICVLRNNVTENTSEV
jgi:copper homeostasis protein CutC